MLHRFTLLRALPLLALMAGCTTKTVSSKSDDEPNEPATEESSETETEPETGKGKAEKPKPDPEPEPEPKEDIAKVVLSGKFANVDMNYQRAGRYIVLTMDGKASGLASSSKEVTPSQISVAKTTKYEILYPTLGACDAPPELTITKGVLQLKLERAGEPNGTISGCYYLAGFVKASDGGFQARLKNVKTTDGRTITELLLDVVGPTN